MADLGESNEHHDELSELRAERDALRRELGDLRAHLCVALDLMNREPGPQRLEVRTVASDKEIVEAVRQLGRANTLTTPKHDQPSPEPATDLITMSERELFANIGRRPGMFLGRADFYHASAFLNGYELGSARRGSAILEGWPEWLIARRGRDCNHAWPGQVLHIALPGGWENLWELPPEDERHAIKALFRLLDEFLALREGPSNVQD